LSEDYSSGGPSSGHEGVESLANPPIFFGMSVAWDLQSLRATSLGMGAGQKKELSP
jgi:hypothetical protein